MNVRNKEKYNAYMRQYHLKRYYRLRNEAIISLGGKCKICGSRERLELDHISKETKEIEVSQMLSVSLDRFWKEVAKCQLLCKSCHSDKTIDDLGRKKAKGNHGTISCYRYCKCDLCKRAWYDHNNEYRKRIRKEKREMLP